MSWSASSLSPVDEGNEEDTRSGSGSVDSPVLVHLVVTSAAPSETFLKLTASGVFKDETDEEHLQDVDEPDSNYGVNFPVGDKSQWETVRENLSYITPKIWPQIGLSDDTSDAMLKQDAHQQETASQDSSEFKTNETSDATASKTSDQQKLTTKSTDPSSFIIPEVSLITTTKSTLARPKMRNNNLRVVALSKEQTKKASPQPRRPTGSKLPATPAWPSVEQAVHRERVNSLLMPASPRATLGKIGPPSVTAQATGSTPRKPTTTSKDNISVTRKISPPHAPPSKPRTSVPNLASTHPRADDGISHRKISPPKLLQPKTTPPRKITPPHKQTTPSQLEKLPSRRKSLPDVYNRSQTSSPKGKNITAMNHPVDSPNLLPRQVPPRRKISEPCFPSSQPISTSPSSLSDRQRGGIFSDPRYNPIIVTPKTTTAAGGSDLARKYADMWRGSVANRPLAGLSSPDSEGSVYSKTLSTFDDAEYEKLKNCRYIRRAAWSMDDDVPNAF